MAKLRQVFSLLRAEGVREAISQTFWSWIFPALFAGLTMLAGVLQDLQIMWILFATAGVGAFVSHILANLAGYQHARTASFKLRFNRLLIGLLKQPDKSMVKIGMELENLADFSLEYRVVSIYSSVANRINQEPSHLNLGGEIGPKATTVFWDSAVDVADLPDAPAMEGRFRFLLEYGKHGRLDNKIEKRFRLFISPDYQRMDWFEDAADVAALRDGSEGRI